MRFRHWLGTDKRGSDLLSGLLNGTRISLFVGIFSMLIASFLGLLSGALAGYAGNDLFKMKIGVMIMMIPGIILSFFYANTFSTDNSFLRLLQYILICIFIMIAFS